MPSASKTHRALDPRRWSLGLHIAVWTTLGLLAGLVFLLNTVWIRAGYAIAMFFLGNPLMWVPVLIFVVLGVFAYIRENILLVAVSCLLMVGSLVVGGILQNYFNDRAMANAVQVQENDAADGMSFTERVPFRVAEAVSARSLGETTGDATGGVKAVPATNTYTTSVIRRGVFQGYESVQTMNLPLFGTYNFANNVSFCNYDTSATLRIGGAGWGNNIEMRAYRLVAAVDPSVHIDQGDAFAVCQGDTPILYMPVTKARWSGVGHYQVPAGIVTYNGHTGELRYTDSMEVNGLPIYPLSVARAQRDSLGASRGFLPWFLGQAGFETTAKDEEDVNAANATEFSLTSTTTKETLYVTPLTPRGSSGSVVGLATVPSESIKAGELAPLTINRYKVPRQAPSTIATTIISSQLSGYKAAGLTVFEVVPSTDGSWTASIGKEQSILYRAIVKADGTVTLVGQDGKVSSDEPGSGQGTTTIDGGKPLSEMTTEELQQLGQRVLEEMAKRAK